MPSPRRPWLAALLSLLGVSGLGQLYNGTPRKAVAFMLGIPAAAILLIWTMTWAPGPPLNIVLPVFALLGLQAWCAVDAARDARRLRDQPRPWHSRWYSCVAVWAFGVFLLTPAWIEGVLRRRVQAFRIPSGGMERTLLTGDHVLVDKRASGAERLSLITFRYPKNRQAVFVKRVIGLPGETVEVRGKTVYVDGAPLSEPYAYFLNGDDDAGREHWGPETVPEGNFFVLGDNRDNTSDSRFWGYVPRADLVGVAKVVYYSRNDREGADHHLRWERIGLPLR
jgi:signal peptidase I